MKCAINMSFANRQVILHRIREVFSDVFHKDPEDMGLRQVYDVSHNTAKIEKHRVDGEWKEVLVHRKGATRAFGPGYGRNSRRLQGNRPARHHRRQHGNRLLSAGGNGDRRRRPSIPPLTAAEEP